MNPFRKVSSLQLSLFDWIPGLQRRPPPRTARRTKRPRASNPQLLQIWHELRREYFPHRSDLDDYTVVWSTRPQKRTLASCNTDRSKVTVARELNYPHHHNWLAPLLYHEMCHACLGNSIKHWHGPEFKRLERRHPGIRAFDQWIKNGGWATAVRSDRSKRAHQARKARQAAAA